MNRYSVVAAAALLAGCANINYIVDNYSAVELREVTTRYDTFRVFDKPAEGRMMVTASLGAAAGQGLVGVRRRSLTVNGAIGY